MKKNHARVKNSCQHQNTSRASYKIHVTILWECRSTVRFTQNLILMLPESYLIEFMKKIILGWKNLCSGTFFFEFLMLQSIANHVDIFNWGQFWPILKRKTNFLSTIPVTPPVSPLRGGPTPDPRGECFAPLPESYLIDLMWKKYARVKNTCQHQKIIIIRISA